MDSRDSDGKALVFLHYFYVKSYILLIINVHLLTFLDMKVEPTSPVRNTNPFSRSSSGSSLHAGNHSSSSGHGMCLNNKSTL